MTATELIKKLVDIVDKYGDMPVLHHDDWENFLVENVRVEPALDGADLLEDCKQPEHVVLEGERLRYDCKTGVLV